MDDPLYYFFVGLWIGFISKVLADWLGHHITRVQAEIAKHDKQVDRKVAWKVMQRQWYSKSVPKQDVDEKDDDKDADNT